MAVIGCLMVDPDALAGEIFFMVSADDFRDGSLKHIFAATKKLWANCQPIDAVTVLAAVGQAYEPVLREAMISVPSTRNWKEYATILKESSRLARIKAFAEDILQAQNVGEAQAALEKAQHILTQQNRTRRATYAEILSRYVDRQNNPDGLRQLKWGFKPLDKNLHVSPGRFIILGADSSVGKTAFALQLARSMAAKGQRVGFFSCETSIDDAGDRIIANAADVKLEHSKVRCLSIEDFEKVFAEIDAHEKLPLDVIEAAGDSVEDIRAKTLAGRYEVIFIDYIQLIPARGNERWQIVTEVSMALHTMSQQLGVTVIALSQVTPPEIDKKGKRRALNKNDLRESRQLINDADVILMMDLEFPAIKSSRRVLMIDKNKDGPLGKMFLDFDPAHMRFSPSTARPKLQELPDDGEPLPF